MPLSEVSTKIFNAKLLRMYPATFLMFLSQQFPYFHHMSPFSEHTILGIIHRLSISLIRKDSDIVGVRTRLKHKNKSSGVRQLGIH